MMMNFESLVDKTLRILFEEEPEVQLGQSSNRTKLGATTSIIKGSARPKHRQSKKTKSRSNASRR